MAKKSKDSRFHVSEIRPAHWNKKKLNLILSHFRGKRILVIGDVGLDRYTIGSVERISPEAPVPIVLVQEEKLKLGLAANVADNIQVLGGVPILVGVVGKDRSADDFREILSRSGIVSSHLVADESRRTALKERVVSERQQLLRIDYESQHTIGIEVEKQILKKFDQLLEEVDGIVIEDYAKGALTQSIIKRVAARAKRARKWIAVDPNARTPLTNYKGSDVLTPNTREAESLSGVMIKDSDSLARAGFAILRTSFAKHVVITRGKEGMAIFSKGSRSIRLIPTCAREVYDVSGAGDTVISVLALALVSGATIEEASVLGNLAAGVEVGKRGTATVSPGEIREALESF